MKNLIVAITGASGVIYAQRLLEFLVQKDVTVHLIVSKNSQAVLEDELFIEPEALYRIDEEKIVPYDPSDFANAVKIQSYLHYSRESDKKHRSLKVK